jgi:hypothetical protein
MNHAHAPVVEKSHRESQTPQQTQKTATPAAIGPEERYDRVAKAAYLRAEHRGFLPGCELQDWLDAEAEIDKDLTQIS